MGPFIHLNYTLNTAFQIKNESVLYAARRKENAEGNCGGEVRYEYRNFHHLGSVIVVIRNILITISCSRNLYLSVPDYLIPYKYVKIDL